MNTISVGGAITNPPKNACAQFQPPKIKNAVISRAAINPQKVAGFIGSLGVRGFVDFLGF